MNVSPGRALRQGAVALLALLTACSSHGSSAATGTLTGHLLLVGRPAPGKPRALVGTIITNGPAGRGVIATDATGSFTVDLPPGRYSLTGRSPLYDDGNTDCQPATRATVRPDRVQRADVYCQAA
jgi:hypothetical protein